MTPTIAFDPASPARIKDAYSGFVEVTLSLDERTDGYRLVAHDGEGRPFVYLTLRPDFLEPFLAQARAREADAA